MRTKSLLPCGLISAMLLPLAGKSVEMPLTNPEAPFVRKETTSAKKSKPFLDEKGNCFRFGAKTVKVDPNGYIRILNSGRETAYIYFYGNTPFSSYFDNKIRSGSDVKKVPYSYTKNKTGVGTFSVDKDANAIIVKGDIPFHKPGEPELLRGYTLTVKLLPDSKLRVKLEYSRPGSTPKAFLAMFLSVPQAKSYLISGKEKTFPEIKWDRIRKIQSITVNCINAADSFTVKSLSPKKLYLTPGKEFLFASLAEKSDLLKFVNEVEFDFLEWSGKARSGAVDLQEADALKTETSPSVNLVPNPYLARGLNYIGSYANGPLWRGAKLSLSSENPKFGDYCLKVPVLPRNLIDIAAISAEPGSYTASMYVRSNSPGCSVTITAGAHNNPVVYIQKVFPVGKEWKRVSVPFKVPSVRALKFRFYVNTSKNPEKAVVYVDGFQLEKGNKATPFDVSPATAWLMTSAPDDFIRSGDPINARMRLATLKPEVSGKMTVTIRNMFGEELAKSVHDFKFSGQEHPEIPLELDGKIPDGVHIVQTDFEVDGKKYTEFSRFSVMPFFRNQHKMRNMFSMLYDLARFCYMDVETGFEELIRRWMYLGVGCHTHCEYSTPELDKLLRKYNYELLDSHIGSKVAPRSVQLLKQLFPGCKPLKDHNYSYLSFSNSKTYTRKMEQHNTGLLLDYRLCEGGWTPEYRQKLVDVTEQIVRKSSPRRIYIAGSEFVEELKSDPHYIDWLLAIREGVKKVYPQAMFGEGGACNMTIGNGIREIDQLLTRLKGKMPIEVIQTHIYTYDVNAIEQNFKALVDVVENKHGLKGMKYYFGEGMHWGPYQVLEWNLEAINWDSRGWNTGCPLSYDIGWMEKLGAAWFMRSWMIFMTKPNQVLSSCSSMYDRAGTFDLDVQMRPRAGQKVPNTLSMLLGNVKDFVKDVSFAKDTKCLIWEDEKGHPVAAVWNCSPEMEQGLKPGAWAKADLPDGVEIFDMMGVRRIPRKVGEFPVSVFPFFLRGKPGEVDRYVKILSNASVIGDDSIPVKFDVKLSSRTHAEFSVTNLTARKENLTLILNGKTEKAELKPFATASFTSRLTTPVSFDKIAESGIRFAIESGSKKIESEEKFRGLAVKHFSGSWDDIPAIPMNKAVKNVEFTLADFSAMAQIAWDKDNFRVRVTVRDDKFFHKEVKPTQRWNNDSFQLFIDTCCNARKKGVKVFDEDDYAYNVYPSEDGKSARVFRWKSPDIQLTLGLAAPKDMTFADDIPCTFTRTKTGYIYELTIPAKYMLPARLESNTCMGIALFLNDRDGEANVRNMLTTTAPCTAPYNKPYLFPQIILSDK